MKNPIKFLTLILTQWQWASTQPQICKRFFQAGKVSGGDEFTADVIRALPCFAGDWRAVCEWLESNRPQHAGRVKKFRAWAAKITAPKKRGCLLAWPNKEFNGGTSVATAVRPERI
jgi:hypothetical protein